MTGTTLWEYLDDHYPGQYPEKLLRTLQRRVKYWRAVEGPEWSPTPTPLCEQEIAQRFQSRISSWTREAKLPRGKSFATLALNDLPQAVQKKIIALRDNTQWAHQADNILLIGPSGVGKSHIAAALGLHLTDRVLESNGYRQRRWFSTCNMPKKSWI